MHPVDNPKTVHIPDCCTEGRDDCPHAVNRDVKRVKTNIGL